MYFAIEVCELCDELRLSFVLEHPLGASSWGERRMLSLLHRPSIHKITADQCAFELRSSQNNYHKKPTAFATNHLKIAETLHRRCPGGHVHEHILGDRRVSRRSQVYPDKLVDAILQAYARSVGREVLNHITSRSARFWKRMLVTTELTSAPLSGNRSRVPTPLSSLLRAMRSLLPRTATRSAEPFSRHAPGGLWRDRSALAP